jgi:mono/diheme cytochrome c family protein
MKLFIIGSLVGSLLFLSSCKNGHDEHEFVVKEVRKPTLGAKPDDESPAAPAAGGAIEGESDLDTGKRIWMTTCTQCHNRDPNIKGAVGPETVDAPLEVMYAKVMTGRYPENLPAGFVPKRSTKLMRKFPQYEKEIPKIWAYVQSVKKAK